MLAAADLTVNLDCDREMRPSPARSAEGLPTTAVNIFLRRNPQVDKRFRAAFPEFLEG